MAKRVKPPEVNPAVIKAREKYATKQEGSARKHTEAPKPFTNFEVMGDWLIFVNAEGFYEMWSGQKVTKRGIQRRETVQRIVTNTSDRTELIKWLPAPRKRKQKSADRSEQITLFNIEADGSEMPQEPPKH